MKSKLGRMVAVLVFASTVSVASQASAQQRTKVGALRCSLAPAVGLIVVEKQRLSCLYTPDGPWPPERYFGSITTVGIDLGFSRGGQMAWAVLAPTAGIPAGALAGEYVGASGDLGTNCGSWIAAMPSTQYRSTMPVSWSIMSVR